MMKNLLLLPVMFFYGLACMGQDIHFSQYYASPMTLNPALTGGFNGDFRVAANYRNQFFGEFGNSAYTYNTYSASFDMPILRKKLDMDQLGVGLVFESDQSGDGVLTQNTVQASVAYHKVVDRFNRHTISLGVQGGVTQERIDFSRLSFESSFNQQLDGGLGGFVPGLASENVSKSSFIYPDLSIGVLWRSRIGKIINLYAGFVYANALKPSQFFLSNDNSNRLENRFLVHGGVDIKLSKYVTLTPGLLYQLQGASYEAVPGIAMGYQITDITAVYVGVWYRANPNESVIPMVAFEVHNLRIGASFDATVSDLKTANNSKGAFEVSLIYIHNNKPPRDYAKVKFCPRF